MGKKAVSRYFYCVSIVLTFALSGITIAGGYAAVSPEESMFYPFLALALPILLLINIAVALYWGIRLRFWWIVPVIGIACNMNYLNSVYRYPSGKTPVPEKMLSIATYNVGSFNNEGMGYSCKAIAQFMRDQKVDVVCMQEVGFNNFFPEDSVKNVFAEWPYCYIPTDTVPLLQLALFSKYPIIDRELIKFDNSRNCSLWVDIDVDGKKIRVFNNHLQTTDVTRNKQKLEKELDKGDLATANTEEAAYRLMDGVYKNFITRAQQAEIIHQRIDSTSCPVLVCGDFNSLPSSYTYKTVKGNNLLDGFQTCGHGYMYTFHFLKRVLRIDYIFHSKDLKGVDYFSKDLEYSDHNPVIMRVGL